MRGCAHVDDVTVIEDPAAAEVSLDPIRARLLAELAEPGSASDARPAVGLTRQKVNYHLRALERHGLIELVEERRKGNFTERLLRATAAVLRDLADRAGGGRTRPVPRARTSSPRAGCWRSRPGWSATSASSSPARAPPASRWRRSGSTARSGSRPPRTGPRSPRSWPRPSTGSSRKYHDETAAAAAPTGSSSHCTPPSRTARSTSHEPRIRDRPRGRPARRPGRRLDGDYRRHRRLAVPDGHGDPGGWRRAARRRAHHDLGPAAPPRGPHRSRRTAPSTRSTTRSRPATAARRTCATSTAGSSPTSGRTSTTPSTATRTSTSHTLGAVPRALQRPRRSHTSASRRHGIDGPEAAGDARRDGRAARALSGVAPGRLGGRRGPRAARRRPATLDGVVDYSTAASSSASARTDGLYRFFGATTRRRRRDERAPFSTASTRRRTRPR